MKKIYKLWALIVALFALGFIAFANAQESNNTPVPVTLNILGGDGSACEYFNYSTVTAIRSFDEVKAESSPAAYMCTLRTSEASLKVTSAFGLKNSSGVVVIPHTWIKMKQSYYSGFSPFNNPGTGYIYPCTDGGTGGHHTQGETPCQLWSGFSPLNNSGTMCTVSSTVTGQITTAYVPISSERTLFKVQDNTDLCWFWNETQLELTIPANTPAGTYSGNAIVFKLYDS